MHQIRSGVITYCTNIHTGEVWEDVFFDLRTHLPRIKTAVSPFQAFPIGLRLSNRAATGLDETESARFSDWCGENGFFVPTINGFPYGDFHGPVVKERVYAPDWRHQERVDYTKRLALLLSRWLPFGITGSVSTVPVCFRKERGAGALPVIRENLIECLEFVDRLRQKTGKDIVIALEPEPGCYLETTEDVLAFFEGLHLPSHLMDCLGICYDCCHQSVEFEDPVSTISNIRKENIRIAKVHVSSAPHLGFFDREYLEQVAEPVYLHQVVVKNPGGELRRFDDIPNALALYKGEGSECRVHFHVPVFLERIGSHATTRPFIEQILSLLDGNTLLEIETYSRNVLPSGMYSDGIDESIIREIQWLEQNVHAANSCS